MTVQQRKRAIGLVAGLVGLAGLAILAAAVAVPLETGAPEPAPQAPAVGPPPDDRGADQTPGASRPTLGELARVSAMDLRRPLHDPPATAAAAPKAASAVPMTVRLVGTIVEPGHSMAVFRKADGSFELCAQGESVTDAGGAVTVTGVAPEKVTVEYAGQAQELAVPPGPPR
jgi:hypothetical protein